MTLRPPAPKVVDEMQVDYCMWSAYVEGELRPLGSPLRLPAAARDEIAGICERFAALIRRTCELCLDRPELLDFWNFPPDLLAMIAAERRRPARDLELLARYDVFPTPGGWKLSEFNTDVPGGIHEAAALSDLVARDPQSFRVVRGIVDLACRDRARPDVGIIYASGWGEDLEQCQYIRSEFNRHGIPAVLGNPSNLRYDGRRLELFGRPVEVLYRFFPAEWFERGPALSPLLRAVADGAVRMINPFVQIVAQSKKGMAFWFERDDLLTADERELVEAHLPATSLFRAARLGEYRRRKDEIVVKRGFGRVGEQVLIGSMCTRNEWSEALDWPMSEPDEWIVQDRFETLPVRLDGETLHPCHGAYVVAGRFAGFYTRAARTPFITTDAYSAAVKVGR